MPGFDTLLVANRGEIACRVIRGARALGLRTVAVHSDADADAPHVRQADAAVRIGPGPARDSYLSIDAILAACRGSGAQAVHPGYGFLSESAAFARACRGAGVTFVGPPPEAIEALGNKSAAKRLAQRLGVPCLPGYAGDAQDLDTLLGQAARVGAPMMIKAAAGGGGRGMRRCDDVGDAPALRALLRAAHDEARAAFGDGSLLLERLLEGARHVEVQVFADAHGGCVHLGERDCSSQRRHQKVLEEAPAPGVSGELRARMGAAAVRLALEVGYVGAGTVEFLLEDDGAFHFLEMNTRLQVEHPVTEAVTGLDLVQWQLRIARGEPLPLAQHEVRIDGHAIEARLCAEDPYADFAPQTGTIAAWRMPSGEGVRVDHGLAPRASVPPFYDSMLAKVIAHGPDRETARTRLLAALRATRVAGLATNRDWLCAALGAEPFVAGALSTAWLSRAAAGWTAPRPDARWLAAAAGLRLARAARAHGPLARFASTGRRDSVVSLATDGRSRTIRLAYAHDGPIEAEVDGLRHTIEPLADDGCEAALRVDGLRVPVMLADRPDGGWFDAFGVSAGFDDRTDAPPAAAGTEAGGDVASRIHGAVARVAVALGDRVERGDLLVTVEAMKMEHRFEAPVAGTVLEVTVAAGQQVAPGRLMVRIAPGATS